MMSEKEQSAILDEHMRNALRQAVDRHQDRLFDALIAEFSAEAINNDEVLTQKLVEEATISGNAYALIKLNEIGAFKDYDDGKFYSLIKQAEASENSNIIDSISDIMIRQKKTFSDDQLYYDLTYTSTEKPSKKSSEITTAIVRMVTKHFRINGEKKAQTDEVITDKQNQYLNDYAHAAIWMLSPVKLKTILHERYEWMQKQAGKDCYSTMNQTAIAEYSEALEEIRQKTNNKTARPNRKQIEQDLYELKAIIDSHAISLTLASPDAAQHDDEVTAQLLKLKSDFIQRPTSCKLDHKPFEYIESSDEPLKNYLIRLRDEIKKQKQSTSPTAADTLEDKVLLLEQLADLAFPTQRTTSSQGIR